MNDFLPEPLPESPMPLFTRWFADATARRAQPNPDAMVLATANADGKPSARVVLCKRIDPSGYLVYFTNYTSRKGTELAARPRAAVVFHWDALHRQVRIEGPVVRSPASESDDYFASRPVASRVGAWASRQSQPLASRAELAAEVERFSRQFGVDSAGQAHVPRPPHWGGFRLWIESIELWVEGPGRIHDRAVWSRDLTAHDDLGYVGGTWRATRLNP
jgi:pyridoxamine 5'-phosphate oxidase